MTGYERLRPRWDCLQGAECCQKPGELGSRSTPSRASDETAVQLDNSLLPCEDPAGLCPEPQCPCRAPAVSLPTCPSICHPQGPERSFPLKHPSPHAYCPFRPVGVWGSGSPLNIHDFEGWFVGLVCTQQKTSQYFSHWDYVGFHILVFSGLHFFFFHNWMGEERVKHVPSSIFPEL